MAYRLSAKELCALIEMGFTGHEGHDDDYLLHIDELSDIFLSEEESECTLATISIWLIERIKATEAYMNET
jgi:hypothetical protein